MIAAAEQEEAEAGTDGGASDEPLASEEEASIDIEAKPEITYDDFARLQFQIGRLSPVRRCPSPRNCCAPR